MDSVIIMIQTKIVFRSSIFVIASFFIFFFFFFFICRLVDIFSIPVPFLDKYMYNRKVRLNKVSVHLIKISSGSYSVFSLDVTNAQVPVILFPVILFPIDTALSTRRKQYITLNA